MQGNYSDVDNARRQTTNLTNPNTGRAVHSFNNQNFLLTTILNQTQSGVKLKVRLANMKWEMMQALAKMQ